jgi:polar amino acid transport system substrate-binding protein
MTLTPEVLSAMDCSQAYAKNAQVVVMAADKAANYTTVESLADLTFAVESGSAGEEVLAEAGLGDNATAVAAQSDALMEVASGSVMLA